MRYIPLALFALLFLTACGDRQDLKPGDTVAICKALVGPIKYTTETKTSKRYAGVLLGLDLKQRNQIGTELRCPQYR